MTKQNQPYVVITGASSGIGAASAKKFAGLGYNLVLVARRLDRLTALKHEIQTVHADVAVVTVQQELAMISDLPKMYQRINDKYQIKVWVNNAGFGKIKALDEYDLTEVTQMVQTNSEAVAVLTTLFTKDHETEDVQLVNVSSRAGYHVWPNTVMYSATKFFVGALTEGLDSELQRRGLAMRAKVLAPNATETEFQRIAKNLDHDVDYSEVFDTYNTSDDLADFLVALLDSDAAVGFVNDEYELELSGSRLP
ncbi:SDR family NAD(P)-dependent oxidoreductase [Oenococcus oeni]